MKRSSVLTRSIIGYGVIFIPLLGCAMSFQEVSERAYGVSGEMITLGGKVEATEYERASVVASEPLSLEGTTRRIRADDPSANGLEYGMMVGFTMKNPQVVSAQYRQYDIRSKVFQYELKRQQGSIQVALKKDWLLSQLSIERVNILAEKKAFAEEAYRLSSKKYQSGRMSQMELLRQETELHNATQEYAIAAMEAEHAQLRLQEMTMIKEEVVVDDLPFSFIHDEGQTQKRINEASSITLLRGREEELNAEIEVLRRSRVDRMSVGVGVTKEPIQNSVDMKVIIPLVWSEKNEKKIAALMSERSALIAQRNSAEGKLRVSVFGALEHLEERENRIKELMAAEKSYENLFRMAHKGFEGGVVSQFEYLATKNAFYDARLRSVALKADYVEEMSAMEEKLGRIW
ncbi:TolC family protein [Sulfuricurvum sp.]|uniref:TolC family protein n=1 Tax=Sulfuricurvum sp. TaxID=2025608 RepID=UPI0035619B2C